MSAGESPIIMRLYTFSNECNISNTSVELSAETRGTYIFLVTTSPIAVLMNLFALIVLTRRRAIRLGSMRVNLITLTIFEILLNLNILGVMFSKFSGLSEKRTTLAVILDVIMFCLLSWALFARNWIITLIALARCVAITRPMRTRLMSTHLFRPKPLAFCTITCLILGFTFSALRMFELHIVVCDNLDQKLQLLPSGGLQGLVDTHFFFQSAIPITIVFITTLIMLIALYRARTLVLDDSPKERGDSRISVTANRLRYTSGARQTHLCAEKQLNYRRTQNQLRATRMITLLAAIFIILEAPIFFCVILKKYFDPVFFNFVTTALKALVVLDSCANVIIYLFMSKRFRQESARLWHKLTIRNRPFSVTQTEVVM
ncbi:hypothetical protein PHET_04935 [Paragonimus heterotremus]|uniref:G-protein coupled receptors family 1 profile domain-containing protein n=1 Tax=Paragonimus heterotremus TaxID=100268 RepID=A0A8J4SME7_9TREM|nr:hypothetical protein PHET_04935 [Paragonimus heterotremus]